MKIFTFRMTLTVLVAVAACLFFSVISNAEADDAAAQFADHFLNKKPAPDVAGVTTLEGAMKIQASNLQWGLYQIWGKFSAYHKFYQCSYYTINLSFP